MRPFYRILVFIVPALFSASSLRAQSAADPSGHWMGAIATPNAEFRVEFDLVKNSEGAVIGTITTPQDKALRLSRIRFEANRLTVSLSGGTFEGTLRGDGQSISGDFASSLGTAPFLLKRTGEARFEAAPKSAPIAKELEGEWRGSLDAEQKQLRIVLKMSNQADGTSTGVFISVDEGVELPVSISHNGTDLRLEVKGNDGVFTATLNGDASELAGTYSLRDTALPLTLQRTKQ
jgi:hypothetical protein